MEAGQRAEEASRADAEAATTALTPLPLAVVLHIFSLLPVDDRLRCLEVCRGWRSVLLERSLWTRLDLTAASGVRVLARAGRWGFDGLLRCAAARAGGGLQSLHVNKDHISHAALLEVVAANAGALRNLHTLRVAPIAGFTPDEAEELCAAAPLLRHFATDFYDSDRDMQAVRAALRNEAPFGPLRLGHLRADLRDEEEAGVVAFAADVALHASLSGLELEDAPLDTPAALDAVVDAALARRMHTVDLYECGLSATSAPALARLLGSDALTTLACWNMDLLEDAPAARVLAAALRANCTLTSLKLYNAGVFADPADAAELLAALHGHPSLRVLDLGNNRADAAHREAVGAALGALVAANTPALTQLDVSWCRLGDHGLRPLFEALPANTHLRELNCSDNNMSDAFVAGVLLPTLRANTSLRNMRALGHGYAVADDSIARELSSRPPL
jgi:hypothetical protein